MCQDLISDLTKIFGTETALNLMEMREKNR